jgi:hypothetical protein
MCLLLLHDLAKFETIEYIIMHRSTVVFLSEGNKIPWKIAVVSSRFFHVIENHSSHTHSFDVGEADEIRLNAPFPRRSLCYCYCLINSPKKSSNGDDGSDLPSASILNFGIVTSRFGTGGDGGEVTLPIKKGNKALQILKS